MNLDHYPGTGMTQNATENPTHLNATTRVMWRKNTLGISMCSKANTLQSCALMAKLILQNRLQHILPPSLLLDKFIEKHIVLLLYLRIRKFKA